MEVSESHDILAGSMAVVRKKFNPRCRRISKKNPLLLSRNSPPNNTYTRLKNLVPYIWTTVVECKRYGHESDGWWSCAKFGLSLFNVWSLKKARVRQKYSGNSKIKYLRIQLLYLLLLHALSLIAASLCCFLALRVRLLQILLFYLRKTN